MIIIENEEIVGWESAIRGMRNPMNSWDKSDSEFNVSCRNCTSEYYRDQCDNCLLYVIQCLNTWREKYLETKDKCFWWQMIQLLPSSYNQKATLMLNYEVLANMYHSRKIHKLDEWVEFCKWIESLPYSELITGDKK